MRSQSIGSFSLCSLIALLHFLSTNVIDVVKLPATVVFLFVCFFPKQLESNYKVLFVEKTCTILTEDLSAHRPRELYLCTYLRTGLEIVVNAGCTGEHGT